MLHEREHILEGPAQKSFQKKYEEGKKLIKRLKAGEIERERWTEIKEKFLEWEKEIESQTELQAIIASKEIDRETLINNLSLRGIITDLFDEGLDKFFELLERMDERIFDYGEELLKIYSDLYSFLKPKIILKLLNRHFDLEAELIEEYEKWKMEEERKKARRKILILFFLSFLLVSHYNLSSHGFLCCNGEKFF